MNIPFQNHHNNAEITTRAAVIITIRTEIITTGKTATTPEAISTGHGPITIRSAPILTDRALITIPSVQILTGLARNQTGPARIIIPSARIQTDHAPRVERHAPALKDHAGKPDFSFGNVAL